MINANELRIGNIVMWTRAGTIYETRDETITVTGIWPGDEYTGGINPELTADNGIVFVPFIHLEPIPLTEEWLLRFGFSDLDYKAGYIGIEIKAGMTTDFALEKPNREHEYFSWNFSQGRIPFTHKLQYVHELQNLYFALCGQELTLNEKEK